MSKVELGQLGGYGVNAPYDINPPFADEEGIRIGLWLGLGPVPEEGGDKRCSQDSRNDRGELPIPPEICIG